MDKDDTNEDQTSKSDGESTDRKLPARVPGAPDQPVREQHSEARDRKRKPEPLAASKKFKKPKDMPKRPLSAYNIYFQLERTKILKKHEQGEAQEDFNVIAVDNTVGDGEKTKQKRQGGVFQALARTIADRWKALAADERAKYENLASIEMQKYRTRMDQYKQDMVSQALEDRRVRKLHGDTDSAEFPGRSSAAGAVSRPDGKASAAVGVSATAGKLSAGARTVSAISSSSTSGTDTSIPQLSAAQELSNFLLQQQASMQPNNNNAFSSNVAATSTTDSSAQQNAALQLAAYMSQQPQANPQFPFAMVGNMNQPQPALAATNDLQSLLQQLSGTPGTAPMPASSSTTTSSTEQQAIQELMHALSRQLQPQQQPNQRSAVQPPSNQLQSSAAQNPSAVDWSQMTSTLAPVANLLTQQPQMAAQVQQQQQQQPDLLSGFLQQLLGNQPSGEQHQSAPPTGQPAASSASNSFFSPEMFAVVGGNTAAPSPQPPLDQNMINMLAQALQQPQQQPLNFPGTSSGYVNPSSIPQQQQQQVTHQSSSPDPFTEANFMALLVQQLLQQQQQQGGNNQHQHQQP